MGENRLLSIMFLLFNINNLLFIVMFHFILKINKTPVVMVNVIYYKLYIEYVNSYFINYLIHIFLTVM